MPLRPMRLPLWQWSLLDCTAGTPPRQAPLARRAGESCSWRHGRRRQQLSRTGPFRRGDGAGEQRGDRGATVAAAPPFPGRARWQECGAVVGATLATRISWAWRHTRGLRRAPPAASPPPGSSPRGASRSARAEAPCRRRLRPVRGSRPRRWPRRGDCRPPQLRRPPDDGQLWRTLHVPCRPGRTCRPEEGRQQELHKTSNGFKGSGANAAKRNSLDSAC